MSKDTKKIEIFIMGKQYLVPGELTILEAMEYAGYQLKRGCGCRAGFCGACATVYRIAGSYQLQVGLACQTKVEPGMYLAQIPFFPGRKAVFDLEKIKPTLAEFAVLYPEIFRCLGCGSCTKVCPQDLDVMQYIAHLQRGEWKEAADLSFDCVMCGLCASRCPVNIVQYNAGLAARRIYGRHVAPPDPLLAERVREIEAGNYDRDMEELMKASPERLAELYNQRDIE
ncbi:MAG TPA: 4Fe-4S dicluster domain-containing protein [Bacillota bacterium]|jgi:formate hydrogenlyase subunit 6/NADH:ubiquinone oxidoreductase subunit I|nr:4Fe-4S dicluster domain-containing protein [Bacillota bacterium]HOB87103.1 4Fe-4S dicluster domain-containing protein [Bacillota bacterium]HOP68419.1 4Fe-4S dicluster domain-containing protein [Bacillota bacterium]HPT33525.1 4Fe-4S dicluster domain-containing protein [Bacillota bacterium]HPZ64372.1 4Fe-4S dicluster domain-containing protein [Bacillota bacterium]